MRCLPILVGNKTLVDGNPHNQMKKLFSWAILLTVVLKTLTCLQLSAVLSIVEKLMRLWATMNSMPFTFIHSTRTQVDRFETIPKKIAVSTRLF